MEKEEILDMLYDFADCLGGTNFKEIKGKFDNITIKAKIENGDDIYLEYCDYDGADSYIGVTFGNKSGLQDCAFNPRLDVSNEVSRLLGNYFGSFNVSAEAGVETLLSPVKFGNQDVDALAFQFISGVNDNKSLLVEEDSEVVSEKRTVKIVEENGKKKKMIKVVKTLKDGSKEVEKFYQDYKEGEDDDDD